jgi:hypothetical protein
VEVNSLSLEQNPYFSNNFAMTSKFITNRGCIRINYRNIDIVQIIEKLDICIYIANILYIICYICMDTHKLLRSNLTKLKAAITNNKKILIMTIDKTGLESCLNSKHHLNLATKNFLSCDIAIVTMVTVLYRQLN